MAKEKENILFENIQFKYEFRDYQKRVLDSFDKMLDDNRIHIVASPGSGKTVLGLEIIKRLGAKCLILVPTISIREQWKERFLQLFVPDDLQDFWENNISSDMENPGIITCITYQSLYSVYFDGGSEEKINNLKNSGYRTILLDESHHLKKEWWKALDTAVNLLDNPYIISLTATPPYDSNSADLAKYTALCGEVDCEVLAPEMVKKKTLCPYQDHVFISVPSDEEIDVLNQKLDATKQAVKRVLAGKSLYFLLKKYDALITPSSRADLFFGNPELIDVLICYVGSYGIESAYFYEENSSLADKVIKKWNSEIVSLGKENSLKISDERMVEVLSETVIFTDRDHFDDNEVLAFTDELGKEGLISNNKITISLKDEEINKMVRNSKAKAESINSIVSHDIKTKGDKLSMIILTEKTGKNDIGKIGTEEEFHDMSCVSIFENQRRREHLKNIGKYMGVREYAGETTQLRMGLLCGSFAILPCSVSDYFEGKISPIGETGYFYTDIDDSSRKKIVSLVTKISAERQINVLVSTISLLGEGWDAPFVNSVIMAGSVKSFVQTNQIRGRGLRLDSNNPDKVAEIWHLVTLYPGSQQGQYRFGEEYGGLCKRFDTILGISNDGAYISNGIERIGLPGTVNIDYDTEITQTQIDFINERTLNYASSDALIMKQWNDITNCNYDFSQVLDCVSVPERKKLFKREKGGIFSFGEIKHLSEGLHRDMVNSNMLPKESRVHIVRNKIRKNIDVYIIEASPKDSRLFMKYYEQLVGDVRNSRYLLRKGFGPFCKYYNIPDYCKNKNQALSVMKNVGFRYSGVIYTRNKEGLELLLNICIKNMRYKRGTISRLRSIVTK